MILEGIVALIVQAGSGLQAITASRLFPISLPEAYDFPFVVAHTGAAFLDLMERLDNGFRFYSECREHITRLPSEFAKRFYYDSCSFYKPLLMMAREIVGSEKLMFGTDYPFIDAGLSHVENLNISDTEKGLIFGGNAARLLGLKSN